MTTMQRAPIKRDWWSKTLAGLLLGFTLAIAVSGIFVLANRAMAFSIRGQLAMWMVAPVWLLTLSCVYFFQSGKRAWLWLIGANALAFGVFALMRGF